MWSVQFGSSLHLDLLWRDIILLEINAFPKHFIMNLPSNRELDESKNLRVQQGLDFLIFHDITSGCNDSFNNNNNRYSFTMQYFMSRQCGLDHHILLVYQSGCNHLFQPCRFQSACITYYWLSSSCSRMQFFQGMIGDKLTSDTILIFEFRVVV